jgi:hypothetical protein
MSTFEIWPKVEHDHLVFPRRRGIQIVMESAPLLRGSPPVGRRMAAAVAATACLVAVTCISFIVASHGGAVTLFAKAPKVS